MEKYFPEEFAREQKRARDDQSAARWMRFLCESNAKQLNPFWLTQTELLRRASQGVKSRPQNGRHHRVSDFADWIYRLCGYSRDTDALTKGKEGERKVSENKLHIPLLEEASDWRLLYRDPLNELPEPLEISLLPVQGRSLYGAPDYVFKNEATGTVLIVEVKCTNRRDLYLDGWPNLRAQLWAYGQVHK